MLVSRFCVKVSDDFAVDDREVNIQEGNGLHTNLFYQLSCTNNTCDLPISCNG